MRVAWSSAKAARQRAAIAVLNSAALPGAGDGQRGSGQRLRRRAMAGGFLHLRQPLIDRPAEQVKPQRQTQMVFASELEVMRTRTGQGECAAMGYWNVLIGIAMQQQHAAARVGQSVCDIDMVQIQLELGIGRCNHRVDILVGIAPARIRGHRPPAPSVRLAGEHVRHHVANAAPGIGEGFHRHHAGHAWAEFVGSEQRGGRAVGNTEQIQRPADFAAWLQCIDHIDDVIGFARAVAGRPAAGMAVVTQVDGDHAIAGLRELQRPGQQRIAIHHPTMQHHHRAAWCRRHSGRNLETEIHIQRMRRVVALTHVAVLHGVLAGVDRTPEDRHAIARQHMPAAVGHRGDGGGDAFFVQQRRGATGRNQALAERGRRRGTAGQPQAGADQQKQARHRD